MAAEPLLYSLGGGLLALLGKEVAAWLVRDVLRRGELARDGVIDIASTVWGVERTYPKLISAVSPATYESLLDYPSRWSIGRPVLGAEIYVRELGNERAHRAAILLFDALDWYARRSDEHHVAFSWLLDHCNPDSKDAVRWDSAPSKERRNVIDVTRRGLVRQANRILFRGYQLIDLLLDIAHRYPVLLRDERSIDAILRAEFQIASQEIVKERAREYEQKLRS